MKVSQKYKIANAVISLSLLLLTVVGKDYYHIIFPHPDNIGIEHDGHTAINPYFKCFICDFVFSALSHDEPVSVKSNTLEYACDFNFLYTYIFSPSYFNTSLLRGPPTVS